MSLKALPVCHWLIHLVSLQQERQIYTRDRKSHGVPFEIWRYFYISFSRRSHSHFPCLLCFSNAYIVSTISTDHGMAWKLKSHVSHLIRKHHLLNFHSLRKEASVGQPTQIRQLTKHLTKRTTKTSFCHATKMYMVYSLPCMHCKHRSTYRKTVKYGQTIFWDLQQRQPRFGNFPSVGLRDSNMRCHSELHIRFRIRNQIVSPFLPFHDLHLSLGSSKYSTDD